MTCLLCLKETGSHVNCAIVTSYNVSIHGMSVESFYTKDDVCKHYNARFLL